MELSAPQSTFGATGYRAWEAEQPECHEFLDGEVFAMAGAEDRHVTVGGNLYISLRQHLSGGPCRTYMIDMRLHVADANSYFYPAPPPTTVALNSATTEVCQAWRNRC